MACCALLAGCGGGERQDADEPSGTFELEIAEASFPGSQQIGETAELTIAVRNVGEGTAPNVSLSVEGFYRRLEMQGLADPERPVFVLEQTPADGETSYVGTWSLGPLPAGGTKEFTWRLTPVVAGTHTLKYTAAAGLDGKAVGRDAGGGPPSGTITARVSDEPVDARVDPETGAVEKQR
jgi:hypothetical protein